MGCATKCVAWLVFIFNIVLACLGVAILTLGVLLKLDVINYVVPVIESKESLYFLPIAVIVVGVTIFVVATLGCVSAARKNVKIIAAYIIILLIIFVVQVCLGIYVLFQVHCQEELQNNINSQLHQMIENYHSANNTVIHSKLDSLQRTWECCGVISSEDWNVNDGFLPPSCCKEDAACKTNTDSVHAVGCAQVVTDNFNYFVRVTYILAFCVAAHQFLGIIFGLVLIVSIKNDRRRAKYDKYRSRT